MNLCRNFSDSFDLSIGSTETKYIKLNTKTQNIFCCVNENLTSFLYTLTGGTRKLKEKKKVFFFKVYTKVECDYKKIIWVLLFSFMYLVSVDPMDRSFSSLSQNFFTGFVCFIEATRAPSSWFVDSGFLTPWFNFSWIIGKIKQSDR